MPYPTFFPSGGQQNQPDLRGCWPDQRGQQMPQSQQSGSWGASAQPGFSCRPVTSREEALAVQVDFYGPGTVMPDLGHGMVYLKRFNPETCVSDFLDFAYCPPQAPAAPVPAYDPKPEIQALRSDLEALRAELEEAKKTGQKKAGGKAEEK